ncbi:antitoxin [Rahnella bonaserana]|uniref:antitoxin n=1 Tax=Rahnella bonaserana TaxID=2816248 RepID=UPI00320B108B
MTDTTKYIVIQCSAWCNASGSGLTYSSDLEGFDKRDKAIKHGFKVQGSDDFNIGVVTNGKLASLDWMAKSLDESEETLAEIAEQIGLEGAV